MRTNTWSYQSPQATVKTRSILSTYNPFSYLVYHVQKESWQEWAKKQEVRQLCSEVVIPKKAPFSLKEFIKSNLP